jgi:RNA polymerase sigma-70 factor (ECF subfamily)
MYKITANLCLDKLKRQKISTVNISNIRILNPESESIETELTNKKLGEIITKVTNELRHKQNLIFTLRYIEELKIAEIKEITGLSAEKIKSNLYVAKQTIRKKLENYE